MESKDGLQHEITADFKRVAADNPGIEFSRTLYRVHGKFSDRQVKNAFGTFTEAMRAAGLAPQQKRAKKDPEERRFEREVEKHEQRSKLRRYFDEEVMPWCGKYEREHYGIYQIVVAGDFHAQFVDQWCLEVFLAECARTQPEVIVLNGDIVDFYKISQHDQSPLREMSMQSEIDYVVAHFFKPLRELCPSAQIDFILGNHEKRLVKYLSQPTTRGLASLRDLKFHNLFKLEEHRINLVARPDFLTAPDKKNAENWKAYGPITVTHGTKTGRHPAAAEFETYGTSGISNHVHRLTIHRKKNRHGNHYWISNPKMCSDKVAAEYIPEIANWQDGFTRAHIMGDVVFMEPIDLSQPIACIGGVYYRKKVA